MRKYRRKGYEGVLVEGLGEWFYVSRAQRRVFLCEASDRNITLKGEMDFDQFAAAGSIQEARELVQAARWEGEGVALRPYQGLNRAFGQERSGSERVADGAAAEPVRRASQDEQQVVVTSTATADETGWQIVLAIFLATFLAWKLIQSEWPRRAPLFQTQSSDVTPYNFWLPSNAGDHYVAPYRRGDGTRVSGHYRTNRDWTHLNNYGGPHGDYYRYLNGR